MVFVSLFNALNRSKLPEVLEKCKVVKANVGHVSNSPKFPLNYTINKKHQLVLFFCLDVREDLSTACSPEQRRVFFLWCCLGPNIWCRNKIENYRHKSATVRFLRVFLTGTGNFPSTTNLPLLPHILFYSRHLCRCKQVKYRWTDFKNH